MRADCWMICLRIYRISSLRVPFWFKWMSKYRVAGLAGMFCPLSGSWMVDGCSAGGREREMDLVVLMVILLSWNQVDRLLR